MASNPARVAMLAVVQWKGTISVVRIDRSAGYWLDYGGRLISLIGALQHISHCCCGKGAEVTRKVAFLKDDDNQLNLRPPVWPSRSGRCVV